MTKPAVGASAAACRCFLNSEVFELFELCKGTAFAVVTGKSDKRTAVSTHKSRLVGTDNLSSAGKLKGTQNGVIEERTALYYYLFAHLLGISYLDYLEKRIFYYRVGKSCGDIGNACTLFLSLLYTAVHKYRTA